jgi:hypothetical protein
MMRAREVREWLDSLPEGAVVGIDDDGMALAQVGQPDVYCEVGALPYDLEAEECPF